MLAGESIELIGEHAVYVDFAMGLSGRKLVLEAAAPTAHNSTVLVPIQFNSDRFLSTPRTREKLGQTFFWNADNLSPSPPHVVEPSIVPESVSSIFMFGFKYLPLNIKYEGLIVVESEICVLDMNWADVETKLAHFIEGYVRKAGLKGIVLGLSGGIDSCTVAALSAKAIGGSKVLGLMLPEEETRNTEDIEHAQLVAKLFGLKTRICDITPALTAIDGSIPISGPSEKVYKGNIKARVRMIYWYYFANKLKRIVCGSSDKSETMMGYFTKWGDVAADIHPLMDLYKTQVRKLARHMGIPAEIARKPSTPGLWPGQIAETELGMKYEQLDLILYGLERFLRTEEISERFQVPKDVVEAVKNRLLASEHKRRPLLTAKLQYRTIGADFRLRRG